MFIIFVNSSIDSYALKKAEKANNRNSKSTEDLPAALESEQELKRKSTKNKKYFEEVQTDAAIKNADPKKPRTYAFLLLYLFRSYKMVAVEQQILHLLWFCIVHIIH